MDGRQPANLTVPCYTDFASFCCKVRCVVHVDNELCHYVIMYVMIFQLTGQLEGVRVGIVKEGFIDSECDVAAMVDSRARSLTQFGATVHDVSIPLHLKGICSTS